MRDPQEDPEAPAAAESEDDVAALADFEQRLRAAETALAEAERMTIPFGSVPSSLLEDWDYYLRGLDRRTGTSEGCYAKTSPASERLASIRIPLAPERASSIRRRSRAETVVGDLSIFAGVIGLTLVAYMLGMPTGSPRLDPLIVVSVAVASLSTASISMVNFALREPTRRAERRIRASNLAHRAWHNTLASHHVEADDG